MLEDVSALNQMVTALVPSLSRSLAEQFNVFHVMHHGTHEKQLSNVFAWLLDADGTHELGDAFQRLFVERVNRHLADANQLPVGGYRITQEVDTSSHEDVSGDIADIVLTNERASVVVENYEWSDGHGHGYDRYLAHGAAGGRQSVVVLLCVRHVSHLLTDGWEKSVVVTYAELLESLQTHIAHDRAWQRAHTRQGFFISELVQHYTEGPGVVSGEDQIQFIKAMCDTGESARYGHRPLEAAAQGFADLVALHAKQQFDEGHKTLGEVKRALRHYAEHTLTSQLDISRPTGQETVVKTPFSGQWQWCVALICPDPHRNLHLEFGPTAVVENGLVAEPVVDPDYTKIFVTRKAASGDGIDRILQSDIGLDEVLNGLSDGDVRLHDALLAISKPDFSQTPRVRRS
ncbi:PD-(D/E)XK nuclease family protein [Ornithinimicrobium faecis]|uniref:PD-(D/E)XK nuclease family protein n=1 Tax=Ornithinimicrobium faecis TaxID=2934158 RepID=A0ABY4YXQ0_9MICO|nr:PD-(D/E)XK nuclease family protein [Ornithinimicrobium sp. HY1793]USQ81563.1 PD-(D/E)XK nuclease family protein [Ornithinimicrobium sp. HY1793]